jgi:hypothetical protein
MLSKYQSFEVQRISRSELQNAPYNPRVISPYNRAQLKAKLEEVGLVETLVWNKQTGNLVGGHQRLSILDELEGSNEYELDVAVVNLSPKKEKELVVFLNNQNTQGIWDETLFGELLKDPDIEVAGMGFTPVDLELEFPDLAAAGIIPGLHPAEQDGEEGETGESRGIVASQEAAVEGPVTDIDAIKEMRKKAKEAAFADPTNDVDYYLVVVFNTRADKNQFLRVNAMPQDAQHITADELATLLKPNHLWRNDQASIPSETTE